MAPAIAAPSWWSQVVRALVGVAVIGYPVLVWFGLTHWSPRVLALILLAVLLPAALLRFGGRDRAAARALAAVPLVTAIALVLAALLDAGGCVLAVPVAINLLLFAAFGATLRAGSVPMIERFARLQEADLPLEKQAWCRLWTGIWCGFFVVNGGIALALAVAAPLSWWALYNGLLAYVFMGALLAGEWILRCRRFPRRG